MADLEQLRAMRPCGAARPMRGYERMTAPMTALEERIAHLSRAVDDLSDVVTQQSKEIGHLTRRVAMLLEREAERESDGGSLPLADERPPHW